MIPLEGDWVRVRRDPKQLNPLALAYIGDSIYEIYVRQFLLAQGEVKPHLLHKAATRFVSAKAQAYQLEHLMDRLNEEERGIVRRGRNAKSGTIPKNASPADYNKATAFEALIGFLHLSGKEERMEELIEMGMSEIINQKKEAKG